MPVSTVAASLAERAKAGDGEQPTSTRTPPALKAPLLWGGQRPPLQAYLLWKEGAQSGSRPGGHPGVFPSAPAQPRPVSIATCRQGTGHPPQPGRRHVHSRPPEAVGAQLPSSRHLPQREEDRAEGWGSGRTTGLLRGKARSSTRQHLTTGMTLLPRTQLEVTEPGKEPPAQQEPCPPVPDPGPLVRVSGPGTARTGRMGARQAGEVL